MKTKNLLLLFAFMAGMNANLQAQTTLAPESLSPDFGSTKGGNIIYLYGNFPYTTTDEYVQDGLVAHYDGINNTGEGDKYHSTTTNRWKNLMGNATLPDGEMCLTDDCSSKGQNTKLYWKNKAAYFGAANAPAWFRIDEFYNPQEFTLEIVYSSSTAKSGEQDMVANVEGGGFSFQLGSEKAQHANLRVHVDGSYKFSNSVPYELNAIQSLSGQYSDYGAKGCAIAVYVNGVGSTNVVSTTQCTTKPPGNNTVWAIGANPAGRTGSGGFHLQDANIYSLRVYNKKLTEDNIIHNAKLDQIRYLDPPTVTIDNKPCTEVTVLSPNALICRVPDNAAAGRKDVVITSAGNTTTLNGAYEYVDAAEGFYITAISQTTGPVTGGGSLTFKGNKLNYITEVKIGTETCDRFRFGHAPTSEEYKCILPAASSPGEVDITITENVTGETKIRRFAKVFKYE